ncbi:hypothetical protein MMC31_006867 [Peltigera leucophlebia]|nr:hypothetical protein [Peltigera leucophlebia]
MDSRVTPLTADFPAIIPLYFKQILENKFDPINISKLCMEVSLVRPTNKSIKLKKGLEITTGEDDAGPNDVKGLAHLLRCLGVYWQANLHFAPVGIRETLSRAFMLYQDRLLRLYTLHTWDSVRLFHFLFHKFRVYQGSQPPDLLRLTPHAEQFLPANSRRDLSAADGDRESPRSRVIDASIRATLAPAKLDRDMDTAKPPQVIAQRCDLIHAIDIMPDEAAMTSIAETFPYLLVDKSEKLEQGPLRRAGWEKYLHSHPEKLLQEAILDIITYGVKIRYTCPLKKPRISSLKTLHGKSKIDGSEN